MVSQSLSRLGSYPHLGILAPVKTVALNNITLSGHQTLDGYTTVDGDRVLVTAQSIPSQNGIYNASSGAWTRATDWNGADDLVSGTFVMCLSNGLGYQAIFTGTLTVGTTEPSFRTVFGTTASLSEWAPGYTYLYQSATVWRVENHDVTNLFSAGRRVRFDAGGTTYYGTVASSTFSTHTDITMTMEGGDSLPNATNVEVYLVSGVTAWSPVGVDPLEGRAGYDIAVGDIALTTYWTIVGVGGRLIYSTDAGLTWVSVATGTTEDILGVAFDSTNSRFMAVGRAGVMLKSTDGINWSLDTTTIPTEATTGTADAVAVMHDVTNDRFWVIFDYDTTYSAIYSDDFGSTWTRVAASFSTAAPVKISKTVQSGLSTVYMAIGNTIQSVTSAGWTLVDTDLSGNATAAQAFTNFDSTSERSYGSSVGNIHYGSGFVPGAGTVTQFDDLNFSTPIRDFAYSSLHQRRVCVGDLSSLGYLDDANDGDADAWTFVNTGIDVLADILAVEWSDSDRIFMAVADNGEIIRSSTGLN